MKSIFEFKKSISILFTDIDDTLTLNGKLNSESYQALWRLQEKKIDIIPITGRPAGWCEMIARFWPVKGVIGENGAFYFSHQDGKMKRVYFNSQAASEIHLKKLNKIKNEILKKVPGSAVSSDQFCRMHDLAIDFCEDVKPLTKKNIASIISIFEKHGATAKASSIHINGWFGEFNKLKMALKFLKNEYSLTSSKKIQSICAFVGDSPNDEPMFEYFENSFAVSNIKEFLNQIKNHPNYLSEKKGGLGFSEIAKVLIKNK